MRTPPLLLLAALAMSGCADGPAGAARCFPADARLPDDAELRRAPIGQSARDLGEALIAGDLSRAAVLLKGDPALAHVSFGQGRDMLLVALASCKVEAIDLLVDAGAKPDGVDGDGLPLRMALTATTPDLAHRLLTKGASPAPKAAPVAPFEEAIARSSAGAVAMLLDFGADPNTADHLGRQPLQIALSMEQFRLAETLLDKGADPWAITVMGLNLGSSTHRPMQSDSREDAAAQQRLRARLATLGWPDPVPTPAQVRRLALDGAWPPAGAKGARPVPPGVLTIIAENEKARTATH